MPQQQATRQPRQVEDPLEAEATWAEQYGTAKDRERVQQKLKARQRKQATIAQRVPQVRHAPPERRQEPQPEHARQERAEAGHTSYILLGRGADALGQLDWTWDASGHHLKAALYLHHLQAKTKKTRPNLGSRELARHLGVSQRTAYRVLAELERRGIVAKHGISERNDPSKKDFYAPRWSVLFSLPGRPDSTDGHDMTVAEMLATLTQTPEPVAQGHGSAFTRENDGAVAQGDGSYLSYREGGSEEAGASSSRPEGKEGQGQPAPPAGGRRSRRSLQPRRR